MWKILKKLKNKLRIAYFQRIYHPLDGFLGGKFDKFKLFRYKLQLDKLNNNYHDPRELLLQSSFQCLVNFMEEEWTSLINWESDPEHSKAWAEMTYLYNWWLITRPARQDIPFGGNFCDRWLDLGVEDKETGLVSMPKMDTVEGYEEWHKYCTDSNLLEQAWEKEDQDMLHRLVEIRLGMWN